MIVYDPNRDWLRDLAHLGTSWTLRRITRAVLAVGLYSAVLSVIILRLNLEGNRLISGVFSLLGLILSIVLVFRTNTAYDRWWEGRKQWGMLVNHSRNLAIQVDACFPGDDHASRAAFARLIANFAVALSGHLRGGVDTSALIEPGPVEDDGRPDRDGAATTGHRPAQIAHAIVARIHDARRDGAIDGFDLLTLKPHTQALLDVAGACERIRKTPIPFSYNVFIKLFIVAYATILPVGLVPEYGYLAVPLTMLLVFALLGLELMAEEIEEPFGLDCNDLPTGTIAATIRADVADLLGIAARTPDPAKAPYCKVF
jgi:ion channel-forming bestrophin family protein